MGRNPAPGRPAPTRPAAFCARFVWKRLQIQIALLFGSFPFRRLVGGDLEFF
jgi:hypothetical protein